jgi:hypothetical protein
MFNLYTYIKKLKIYFISELESILICNDLNGIESLVFETQRESKNEI